MTLGRRLLTDTIVYGLAHAIARALSFLLLPIYTRTFSTLEFGAYDLALSFNRALALSAQFGMDTSVALVPQGRDAPGQRRAATSSLLMQILWSGVVALAALLASRPIAAALYGDPAREDLVVLASLLAMTLAINAFTVSFVKWRREPARFFLLTVGGVALSSTLSVTLVLRSEEPAHAALLGLLAGSAIFVPVGIAVCWRHMGTRAALADMIACLRGGMPFAAVSSAELVFALLVRLTVASAAGLAAVGIFGAANTICLIVVLIGEAFSNAWWPYALSEEGVGRVHADTGIVMRLYAFCLILLVAAVMLFAGPLVALLLGQGAFQAAAEVVGPMAFAYWLRSVRQNATVGLVVSRQIWLRALLNLIAVAASLALAVAFARPWGLAGVVWGFALGEAAGLLLQVAVLHRVRHQRLDLGATAAMAAAFCALMSIAGAFPPAATAGAILLRIGAGAVFVGVLVALRAVRLKELRAMLAAVGGTAARIRSRRGDPVPRA